LRQKRDGKQQENSEEATHKDHFSEEWYRMRQP
jgi:hypothetical protein